MSCPYCKKEIKHRKPCKVFLAIQKKEREEEEKRKIEAEKQRLEMLNTTNDVEVLRAEMLRLRSEVQRLKDMNNELIREMDNLENPEPPYPVTPPLDYSSE